MLSVLRLFILATVGEVLSSEAGTLEFFTHDHDLFTGHLRSFANNYHRHLREADTITLAEAKITLRLLQVYEYTTNSSGFDEIRGQSFPLTEAAKFCTMGAKTKVGCNYCTCVAGQMYICTGTICPSKSEDRRPCENGEKRQIDSCNYCLCRNGVEICTKKNCQKAYRSAVVRSHDTDNCKNGQSKREDCNDCSCKGGNWVCTLKLCKKEKEETEAVQCKDGQTKKIDCNRCGCIDGRWFCTLMKCRKNIKNTKKLNAVQCKDGQTKKVDCNRCGCINGGWLCNLIKCGKNLSNKKEINTAQCKDGQTKKINCNRCSCINGGWLCTLMKCGKNGKNIKKLNAVQCKDGQTRKGDCNRCGCINGRWFCTLIKCKKNIKNKNKKYKNMNSVECRAGQSKKEDCNSCHCIKGTWACTLIHCSTKPHRQTSSPDKGKCSKDETLQIKCMKCTCIRNQWHCSTNRCRKPSKKSPTVRSQKGMNECIEWRRKTVDCNRCLCYKGEWFCTKNLCNRELFPTPPKLPALPQGSCTPGALMELNCVLCKCARNRWRCSNVDCEKKNLDKRVCKEGTSWMKDACNRCYCHNEREYCELKNCYERNSLRRTKMCTGFDLNYDHPCKLCKCVSNYWLCSGRWCSELHDVHKFPEVSDKETMLYLKLCIEGQRTKLDRCTDCLCYADRRWRCLITCDIIQSKPDYTPTTHPTELYEEYGQYDYQLPTTHPTELYKEHGQYDYQLPTTHPTELYEEYGQYVTTEGSYIKLFFLDMNDDFDVTFHLSAELYGEKCKPGSMSIRKCNQCYCYEENWYCKTTDCKGDSPKEIKASGSVITDIKETGNCVFGKVFRVGPCTRCICEPNGYNCTDKIECISFEDDLGQTSCTPGKSFKRDPSCGRIFCTCYSKGFVCSDNECPPEMGNFRRLRTSDSSSSELEDKCRLGDTYRQDACNYCYCDKNRERICTNHKCPYPKSTQSQYTPSILEEKCTLGVRFRKDKCNYCYCNYELKLICSRNTCYRTKESTCCNQCQCTSTKRWKCTQNICPSIYDHLLLRSERKSCIDGSKRNKDCNHCICHKGVELCTQIRCWHDNPSRSYIHLMEPECEHGESIPAPDACNMCICMNNDILCTEYPCLERKVSGRSGKCTEGDRYYLEDRCNFCVCQESQEFCTARACLVDDTSPKDKCKEGEMTKSSDGCNMCVCTEGILSCTDFKCPKSRLRKDPLDTGESKPFTSLKSKEKAKCVEGKMYVNEEDDPYCPDTCFCDNGELLCTNRKCDWGHGKAQFQEPPPKSSLSPNNMTSDFVSCVDYEEMPADDACSVCMCLNNRRVCTKVHCTESEPNVVSSRLADVDNLFPASKASFGASCVDYEEMPSSFACTSCICLNSRKVCTKIRCPESHTPQLADDEKKANQNRNAKNKEIFCEPFTFFSPDNNRYCRNCFCLHNGLALCLLNLCKYSKEVEHKSRLFESGCIPGETVNPNKCLSCTCSDQKKWVCYGKALRECQERDCDAKDEFHMGFKPYCAECQCSLKEWFCSIKPKPCKGNAKCPMGTLIQNPNQHCSVCLCGGTEPGSQNMCFTEVKCVKQVINQLIN
ncbi:hypothetical protein B5X24_HaOG215348 [Helicoverpa armigera]|nr:hypothetical protein B5X24_HaOG215348 [Helicoverpa armigera]